MHGPLKAIPGARGLIRMQRTNSPRFAIDKWNVNAVTLEDGHRTNNVCESWNNAFNKLIGHKNPGLWHVISCIQKDQLAVITELERIRIGDPAKKQNRRHTGTLQQRLKTLCEKLNSNEKTLPEFLHAVGHCIRF